MRDTLRLGSPRSPPTRSVSFLQYILKRFALLFEGRVFSVLDSL
jgi:hypothetical protein